MSGALNNSRSYRMLLGPNGVQICARADEAVHNSTPSNEPQQRIASKPRHFALPGFAYQATAQASLRRPWALHVTVVSVEPVRPVKKLWQTLTELPVMPRQDERLGKMW